MVQNTAKFMETALAPEIDVEEFLALRASARNQVAKKGLEALYASFDSKAGSLPDAKCRKQALAWVLGKKVDKNALAAENKALAAMILHEAAMEAKDFATALKEAERAVKLAPTKAVCAVARIKALRSAGRLKDALDYTTSVAKDFSDCSIYLCQRGLNSEACGNYEEAIEFYRKAYELDASNSEAVFRLACLADLRGDEDTAAEFYRKVAQGKSGSFANAMLNLALLHEDRGEYQLAIACCIAVLRQDPYNHRARLFRRDIEESMQMYYSPEEARESERMEAVLRVPVSDFELSVRSRNCLNKMNIRSLGDLVRKSEQEMLGYKNFGETSLREIKEILVSRGLRLGMIREEGLAIMPFEKPKAPKPVSTGLDNTSIDDLELSVRSRKCMERMGIHTIGQLLALSETDLHGAKNFGRVSLQEIKQKLVERNLSMRA